MHVSKPLWPEALLEVFPDGDYARLDLTAQLLDEAGVPNLWLPYSPTVTTTLQLNRFGCLLDYRGQELRIGKDLDVALVSFEEAVRVHAPSISTAVFVSRGLQTANHAMRQMWAT